jgi:hypothetical protein
MHAVLITFESSAEMDDLKGPFTDTPMRFTE